jgi:hypothetical protein
MANPAAGVTATWGGTQFAEVVAIKVNYGGGLPVGRSEKFSTDLGTIEISCLNTACVSATRYGDKAEFSISGGGLTFTHKCIYVGCTLDGAANDIARYSVTLKPIK